MAEQILNNPNWVRGVEMLYPGQEYTGSPLKASYTPAANPILPGMVVALIDGEIRIADKGEAKGAYLGLMFSEFSTDLDETDGNTIDPVVIRGPATCGVLNKSLNSGKTYAVSNSEVVELIAVEGKLVPRETVKESEAPTVATLTEVQSDRIIVQLQEPSAAPSGA